MKYLFLLFFLHFYFCSFSQININKTETETVPPPPPPPPPIKSEKPIKPAAAPIIEFPDVSAGFPGGSSVMMKWINDNLVYPQISIENNHQGRVFVSFVIEKDGSITNITVERGISVDLDNEAKRIVGMMPKWIPGENSGSVVRSRGRLPINFTLN